MRHFSLFDHVLCEIDTAIRTLLVPKKRVARRPNPGEIIPDHPMSEQEKRHVAGLMRVNHAGEVCAQALYQGQALTAKLTRVKAQMAEAAAEEIDHLAWCEQRLDELNSQVSRLNPLWYSGSLMIGMLAGLAGDQWSLGFVAETERQVSMHLEKHLKKIPPEDDKTKAILAQMKADETHHAQMAHEAGAAELPYFIKQLMNGVSKLMTQSSYYI
ncbi:2-polyprenyl-3-methyl-6-methoxy-1,4-benzoquinone monooxygenase [Legionella nagasakiensis]|uniref:2-polyprenyl-3-methyl-6-methoxy-1,4-benzoquinone monooxygenase n=1 Tax=Legionella nagasakiensis TaxID=535290 RepID=UPI001055C867|nr:2-polyprenyl-3-methyl-6-methoxy-1,4-benzoquinone monooxygenase [Legionella nagasakiensis]